VVLSICKGSSAESWGAEAPKGAGDPGAGLVEGLLGNSFRSRHGPDLPEREGGAKRGTGKLKERLDLSLS